MRRRERKQRKATLLLTIEQQRLDLNAGRRNWLDATARFDRNWLALVSIRQFIIVSTGLVAIWRLRHPRGMKRWFKRSLGLWSSWRLIRSYRTARD